MADITQDAQVIVTAAQNIKATIQQNGFGTASTMVMLGELLKLTQVAGDFASLPKDQRDEFLAEVWDASIGDEPNALVTKVGIFEGAVLEQMSDAIKGGALAYFNRQLPATA